MSRLTALALVALVACGDKTDDTSAPEGTEDGGTEDGGTEDGGSDDGGTDDGGTDDGGTDDGGSGDDTGVSVVDEDGDGSPADEDCDDNDADRYPEAEEDCSDGIENDCDGLMDCEDGDCLDSEHCVESICWDGLDNDGDGLTDCQDDDCFATDACRPQVLNASITGGSGTVTRTLLDTREAYRPGSSRSSASREETVSAVFTGITGTLLNETYLGSTTSCTWSVNQVSWLQGTKDQVDADGISDSFWWIGGVNRSGFAMSSACPVSTSAFLPVYMDAWTDPLKVWGADYAWSSDFKPTVWRTSWPSWYVAASATTATTNGSGISSSYTKGVGGRSTTYWMSSTAQTQTVWTIPSLLAGGSMYQAY